VAFTVKAAEDFTSAIGNPDPGTIVYLDGPHGAFCMDRHEGPGFVFIGAGVGVTPLMSMLRTLTDREDTRPCYHFLGNRDQDSITFREDIEGLGSRLNLEVVHMLGQPGEGWQGEKGHFDAAVLDRHLPARRERLQYFICGPERMMDAAERAEQARYQRRARLFRTVRDGLGAPGLHDRLRGLHGGVAAARLPLFAVAQGG
jgi:predicted ferric reductase